MNITTYKQKKIIELFKITEDKEIMLKELKTLQKELIHNLPQNKLKLALIHSPIHLTAPEIKLELAEFDYFLSGHMHNGCVPPILYEFWNSSRGFIAPNKSIFPENERNTLITKNDKLIVNSPLTMFQNCSGKMQLFNFLYPAYITTLNVTPDKIYNKIKILKKTTYQKYLKK